MVETGNAGATRRLGCVIGRTLRPGAVVAISGGLGAGKTTLAQGLGQGLGIATPITSPTYTLVASHAARGGPVQHVDLYRLRDRSDLASIDWDGLFEARTIVMVEWPERAGPDLPDERLAIAIHDAGSSRRSIVLTPHGEAARRTVEAVEAAWI